MSTVRVVLSSVMAGVAVVVVAAWPGGVPVFWAVALALPAAALTALGARLSGPLEPLWTPVPDAPSAPAELQAATLAARLAEAAADRDRFLSRVQPRLRRLVLTRLRERWPDVSDVDDPRVRSLLGPEHTLLVTDAPPTPQRLSALLDRLEEA
ncbi:hypothetical protein [Actinokineospora sp. UTMC 2448]|uniref:hypothetical protein n=1 Tax=Actinokineospora sp. UTMC 2448 TaxID=2268449 RepID=UPI002164A590|nr:hypothetical protein [Actinokineospora sp. UTMC 2448]UVS76991.1 hypothetical protein Actkin_00690 [Actinokineospora sp. UTMC 2448]